MAEIWTSADWPNFGYDSAAIETALADLAGQMGEMRGLHSALSVEEREAISLREIAREAVHSFGIEGVRLDPEELEASVVRSLAARNLDGASRRSDAVAQMMLEARDPDLILDDTRLFRWHRLLFQGLEVEDLGRWRSFPMSIVRSAVAGREDVLFTAPPADRVADEMDVWFDALSDEKGHPAVRAAILHLWFETIHPFSDGNGRIGRAVIEHVFARSGALPFSLSRQIEADKKGYYAALQAGRRQGAGQIDATAFVVWFLEAMGQAAQKGLVEARFLIARNRFFAVNGAALNPRQDKVLRRLFAEGPTRVEQGLTARSYSRIAATSAATATRDLAALAARGILLRGPEGGRSVRYHLTEPREE